jgi:hypothetical protein
MSFFGFEKLDGMADRFVSELALFVNGEADSISLIVNLYLDSSDYVNYINNGEVCGLFFEARRNGRILHLEHLEFSYTFLRYAGRVLDFIENPERFDGVYACNRKVIECMGLESRGYIQRNPGCKNTSVYKALKRC